LDEKCLLLFPTKSRAAAEGTQGKRETEYGSRYRSSSFQAITDFVYPSILNAKPLRCTIFTAVTAVNTKREFITDAK
jgi:hypothetical protein